ncbi:MAG TPA: serine hydrolase domain-containing protein, partial [Propionibacteriaceae bacterium]|nr:serine hydrolase domain-containing protein [Propionibacteriaceae bacterium]
AETLALSHDHGGALHIRVAGNVVADLWGGQASIDRSWQQDTPSVIFSCTKGLVAILIGELVREGRLDLDAPARTYWPEFAAQGKESIPVRWLLSHRAGLPATRRNLQLADIMNWDRMVHVLAEEEPLWPPGAGHRYHALTYGWLAGEIIRRITGMAVEEFFVQRVVRPLKVDAWIGVPEEELPRVAQLYQALAPPAADLPVVDPEAAALAERAMTLGALPAEIAAPNIGFNSDEIRRAVIPGAGGVATAQALATIWGATVSEAESVRLLNDEVIADMCREQSAGEPLFPLPGPWQRWGTGFMLTSERRPFLTEKSFGHDGLGGQVAFADPEYEVGFAYLTNDLQEFYDSRGVVLVEALQRLLNE